MYSYLHHLCKCIHTFVFSCRLWTFWEDELCCIWFVLQSLKILLLTRSGGSCLWSQQFERLRWVNYLRSGVWAWPMVWNPISTKNTKISWVWWHAPVVPATWEAEAGELLEPGRQRLQWAEIVPLHSRLAPGNRARLCLKNTYIYIYKINQVAPKCKADLTHRRNVH